MAAPLLTLHSQSCNVILVNDEPNEEHAMMTETEIRNAIVTGTVLQDYDGETGQAVEIDTDGETLAVRIVSLNFDRWTDSLDLVYA
jgi:hypothetical protein